MDSSLAKAQRVLIALLAFFVVLVILPLTPKPTIDVKILGYELVAFAALALWLFSPRNKKETDSRPSALHWLLLAFFWIYLAAAFLSSNVGHSLFREFVKVAALAILFLAAADAFRTPKQVWGLIGVLSVAVSLASLYGIAQSRGIDPFPWQDSGEVSRMMRTGPSTFGNPNLASHVLAPAIVLACGLCTRRKCRWAVLCVLIFLGHFALTRTRGSLLAVASAFLLILIAQIISRNVKRTSHAVALTFGAMFLVFLMGAAGVTAVTKMKTGQPFIDDSSLLFRYHSFYGACRMIQDKPWLGHGPGMYQVANPPYWTLTEQEHFKSEHRMNYYVHNEPLEIAVEAGLAAGIVYVGMLLLGVYYGLHLGHVSDDSDRRSLGFALAGFFFAFLVDGMFGFNFHAPVSAVLLFVIAGATAGVWRHRRPTASPPPFPSGWFPLSWRVLVLSCALLVPIFGIRSFAAECHQRRGQEMFRRVEYAEAATQFEKAASLAPYDWLPPFYLGVIAMRTENHTEAEEYLARTLYLNPNYVDALFRAAETMTNLAATSPRESAEIPLNKAAEYARRTIAISALFPDAHDVLGRISLLRAQRLAESGDSGDSEAAEELWREAESRLRQAIACDSKHQGQVHGLIATARLARGDSSGARKALVHSLKEAPDEMETWDRLLNSCRQTGQYDSIRTTLDWGIELLAESENASEKLSRLYLLHTRVLHEGYGDEMGAEKAFVRAVERDRASVDAWAAFHAFTKLANREQAFIDTFMRLATRESGAAKALPPVVEAVAIGLGKDEQSIMVGTAKLVDALGQHQAEAMNVQRTAEMFTWAADVLTIRAERGPLSLDGGSAALLNLGLAYGACENFGESARLTEKALPGLSGENLVGGLVQLGVALTELGRTGEALRTFELAAERAPSSFEAHYGLARALDQDGQSARAREEYLAVLTEFELDKETRQAIRQKLEALPK